MDARSDASTMQLAWITERCPDVAATGIAGEPGFLYRRGQLVARLADVPRIRAVGRRRIAKVEKLAVDGFALLRLASKADALALAREVADRHGEPLATPNHVFRGEAMYLGGASGSPVAVPYLPPPVPVRGRGRSPRVAVLDTGWVLHRWLWRIPANLDLDAAHAEEALALDQLADGGIAGHGTFTAGLVLRACPEARIVFRRLLDGAGLCDEVQLATTLDGLRTAPEGIPDVVLVPAGGYTQGDRLSPVLAAALTALPESVAVVAAAGNAGVDGRPFWPAAAESVVAVGALTRDGCAAPFTNRGPWVDAATVGTELESAYPDLPRGRLGTAHVADGYARWSGTSFAAAVVAGVIAARTIAKGQPGDRAARSVLAAAVPLREVGILARRIPVPAAMLRPMREAPEAADPPEPEVELASAVAVGARSAAYVSAGGAAQASAGRVPPVGAHTKAHAGPQTKAPAGAHAGAHARAQAGAQAKAQAGANGAAPEVAAPDPLPEPDPPARETLRPETPAPETSSSETPGPETPSPETPTSETPAPPNAGPPQQRGSGPLTRGHPVGVGFAPVDLPGQPLARRRPLDPGTDYLFWFELGAGPAPGGLPQPVTVVLARFDGELVIDKDAAVGEIEILADGSVAVTRRPAGVGHPSRLYFPVRTPTSPGTYRLRCSLCHGDTLLQSVLVEVKVGAQRFSLRSAVTSTVDYQAPGD
jgi:hypothetical protein